MTYENPPSRIAGRRPLSASQPSLHVDYADVLAQAVVNEREKVLRELAREVSQIRVDKSYNEPEYKRPTADSVRKQVLSLIRNKQS